MEQGGLEERPSIGTSFNTFNIILPIEMAGKYQCAHNGYQIFNGGYGSSQQILPLTNTEIQILRYNCAVGWVRWTVCGISARGATQQNIICIKY